jgi:hypothetical protein
MVNDSRAVRCTGGNPACALHLQYWIRKRFQHTHNLRLGLLVFGSYCLVMGLMALRYAAQLGLVSPKVATDNYPSFSIVMLMSILISVGVSSFVKLE